MGIKDSDGKTAKTVAVKMVKSQTNVAALEALVITLKGCQFTGCLHQKDNKRYVIKKEVLYRPFYSFFFFAD